MWSVNDMVGYSELKYGRALCAKCMRQAEKNV